MLEVPDSIPAGGEENSLLVRTRFPSCHLYSDPTISRHLLYRGISISRELSSTAPPSDYLRSRQMSSSHFQQQLCKISRILVSKFITLQKSCRKRFFFTQTGYHPSRKMSPQYIKHPLFLFSSYCDLSSRCQRSCAISRSRYLLIWKL